MFFRPYRPKKGSERPIKNLHTDFTVYKKHANSPKGTNYPKSPNMNG